MVSDIAEIKVGHLPRLGIAGQDQDDDIVQGTVLMHRGAQSMPTIKAVEAEVKAINASDILPPGVKVERIYDRSDLIKVTTHTVIHNLIVGVLLKFTVWPPTFRLLAFRASITCGMVRPCAASRPLSTTTS